jgi:thioredoxin reductase (NADPH)
MHQASLLGEAIHDAKEFGWNVEGTPTHDWPRLVENVQTHIKSLNWGYKVALREKSVKYLNELGKFVGPNQLELTDKKGKQRTVTARDFVVAVGGRPKYPDIPGAKEFGITSDDIFSLPHNPGSILIVGASYIALECAGFLKGLGLDVTVMVRSILLRGFDQDMAEKIGVVMENAGINFIRPCVPTKLEKLEDGAPGKLRMSAKYSDGTDYTNDFNTVIFAIGREADTAELGLSSVGVKTDPSSKKIIADDSERSSASNIYAIGDVLQDKPELTPVAIQAGKLLARRICGAGQVTTDYKLVPTTVFTPVEYGTCGLSEEEALERVGKDSVEVYHSNFWPLEWTVSHRPNNVCYVKLIVDTSDDERIVGFHYLGPNAGEVTQAFAGMMKLRATKADMEGLVGIHPTCAEIFTTLSITKSSGADAGATGC